MTESELRLEFNKRFMEDGKYIFRRWRLLSNKGFDHIIDETKIKNFYSLAEKKWSLINPGIDRPLCNHCKLKFTSLKDGKFNQYCSTKCQANSLEVRKKTSNTLVKIYGSHHMKNKKFMKNFISNCKDQGSYEKMVKTNNEKNGGNSFSRQLVKQKIKKQNLLNYGVENPQQRLDIKEKTHKTNLEKYRSTSPFGNKKVQNKIIETNLQRYGVKNPQQSESIRNKTKTTNLERYGQDGFNPVKTKQTNLEKYGVEYSIQNSEIFEKIQRAQVQARFKYKSFVSPGGNIIWYQGYEKYVIEYLFDAGISEEDLFNDRYQVPVISYFFENKNRKYFPDIFIKSKKMLIEVKSTYEFDKEIQKNLAKQSASKDAGYHHIIIIWSKKDNCIDQII